MAQNKAKKPNLEGLTASQREGAARWADILEDWERFRLSFPDRPAAETDRDFAAICSMRLGRAVSVGTLYRKRKARMERGAAALADRRGRHGGRTKALDGIILEIFKDKYLDGRRHSVAQARNFTELELKRRFAAGLIKELPKMPSEATFHRAAAAIPKPLVMYYRHGRKAYIEQCEPYIRRLYDMAVNDYWVCDNHTFNVFVRRDENDGSLIRPHLTAFIDARSRKLMGWHLTENPNSQATIYALRRGIRAFGKPANIYADNGREFTAHDVGGRGYRKKKSSPEDEPTILKNLDIGFRTAIVENARAKPIERAFRTYDEQFSRLFESYTGRNILEKPDALEKAVKRADRLPTMEEFARMVDVWVTERYNNAPHRGEGMGGLSPNEVYEKYAPPKREVAEDELNLLLMRWSNKLKVGKNGVTLTLWGKKLQYSGLELWSGHFGEYVYVRYDPEDMSKARIYNLDEVFICEAELETPLGYAATREEIAREQAKKRAYTKIVKDYKKARDYEIYSNLSLVLGESAAGYLKLGKEGEPRIRLEIKEPARLVVGGGAEEFLSAESEADRTETFLAGLNRLRKEGFYD
jgi:transposase InsO family protein